MRWQKEVGVDQLTLEGRRHGISRTDTRTEAGISDPKALAFVKDQKDAEHELERYE